MAVLQTARGQEHQREVRQWPGLPGSQAARLQLAGLPPLGSPPGPGPDPWLPFQVPAGPGAAAGGGCPPLQRVRRGPAALSGLPARLPALRHQPGLPGAHLPAPAVGGALKGAGPRRADLGGAGRLPWALSRRTRKDQRGGWRRGSRVRGLLSLQTLSHPHCPAWRTPSSLASWLVWRSLLCASGCPSLPSSSCRFRGSPASRCWRRYLSARGCGEGCVGGGPLYCHSPSGRPGLGRAPGRGHTASLL